MISTCCERTLIYGISMRIRGAETEMSDLAEETNGEVDSVAKLRDEILALSGVDIMQDED